MSGDSESHCCEVSHERYEMEKRGVIRELKSEVMKCRESIRSYAEGVIHGVNKEFQERMVERASNWERKMKSQSLAMKELKEQHKKVDLLMSDAVDTISGEAAQNIEQMVKERVSDFKEEVRQMIDSHLEDRFEDFSAKRRKTEPESVIEGKKTSVDVVPIVDVVSEDKKESEASSTLRVPMEVVDTEILSAPGDHASTSESIMSITANPGPYLEFGCVKFARDQDISLEEERKNKELSLIHI